jgi:hypothetical protein
MPRQTSPKVVLTLRKQPEVKPKKRLVNPHGLAQIILAVAASILLGALVGRVYVAVSKTHAFKQTRSDVVSFVTGRPRFEYRKVQRSASDPYRSQLYGSNN